MKKTLLALTLVAGGGVAALSVLAATPSNTLIRMVSGDIDTLDPALAYDSASLTYIENVYETLVGYKGKSIRDLEPLLASEMPKLSNNGRTITTSLRKNVKFHSGSTMTCEDAEYSFERVIVVNGADSWAWFIADSLLGTSVNANDDKNVTWAKIDKSVECNNAGQLVFNLAKTDPAFVSKLVFAGAAIIEKKWSLAAGEWSGTEKDWKSWVGKDLHESALNRRMNGTGPYQLQSITPTQQVFKAFPEYWAGKAKIDNVVYQLVPEQATRVLAMGRGDADFVSIGDRPTLAQFRGIGSVRIVDDLPSLAAGGILLNQNIKNPEVLGSGKLDGKGIPANFFSDVNVRRAFAYGFDADRYIREVLQGKGEKITMAMPPGFPGYDATIKRLDFNPEAARTAFRRAWGGKVWENGFVVELRYRANSTGAQSVAEILKTGVERINPKFKVNVVAQPWSTLLTDSRAGKAVAMSIAWLPDYADADNYMRTYYHSSGYYNPRMNFKDSYVDALLDQAIATTDQKKRETLYKLIGQRVADQVPLILTPVGVGWSVMNASVKGYAENYNPMVSGGTLWKDLSK